MDKSRFHRPQRPARSCPVCHKDPGSGDVPPDDPHAKSDAQMHLARCIAAHVRGPVRDALAQMCWGDQELQALFGNVPGSTESNMWSIDDVRHMYEDVVEAFMRGGNHDDLRKTCPGPENIWISRHPGHDGEPAMEVLVIEPHGPKGPGQYEVAVRIPRAKNWSKGSRADYVPGYAATTTGLRAYGVDH